MGLTYQLPKIPKALTRPLTYILVMLVILVKPAGLFGKTVQKKV